MEHQRAVEQAGAGAARAVLLQRFDAGGDDVRIHGQPEIVVAAEHDPALALHDDLRILPGLEFTEIGKEILLTQLVGQGMRIALFKNIHSDPP